MIHTGILPTHLKLPNHAQALPSPASVDKGPAAAAFPANRVDTFTGMRLVHRWLPSNTEVQTLNGGANLDMTFEIREEYQPFLLEQIVMFNGLVHAAGTIDLFVGSNGAGSQDLVEDTGAGFRLAALGNEWQGGPDATGDFYGAGSAMITAAGPGSANYLTGVLVDTAVGTMTVPAAKIATTNAMRARLTSSAGVVDIGASDRFALWFIGTSLPGLAFSP